MELHPEKGVFKKRPFQTPGNTLTAESVASLGTTEGNIIGRKKIKLKPTDYVPTGNSPSREAAQTPAPATSKQGLGREAWAALLRVRTRPECPQDNLRELTWDSKPDCEIATIRKALRHQQDHAQNKGLNRISQLQIIPLQ